MPNLETGGGAHVTGNASADRDFVGRDATNHGNQVHVAMERIADVSERETETIAELSRQIGALTKALAGDPLRLDGVGLIQQVRDMDETNKRREWWRVLSTWVLVALLASQVVQGWLLWQVYQLYWAIYQAVQMAS